MVLLNENTVLPLKKKEKSVYSLGSLWSNQAHNLLFYWLQARIDFPFIFYNCWKGKKIKWRVIFYDMWKLFEIQILMSLKDKLINVKNSNSLFGSKNLFKWGIAKPEVVRTALLTGTQERLL